MHITNQLFGNYFTIGVDVTKPKLLIEDYLEDEKQELYPTVCPSLIYVSIKTKQLPYRFSSSLKSEV